MTLSDLITPGMAREETFLVEEKHTAYHIGSGDEKVLGTPWMITLRSQWSAAWSKLSLMKMCVPDTASILNGSIRW